MAELTRRQRSIYEFIVGQVRRRGIPPTLMEIADAFGLSSAAGVSDHLKAIERKGYIRRRPGASRGIELAATVRANQAKRSAAVPVIGEVPSQRGLRSPGAAATHVYVDRRLGSGKVFAVRARESVARHGVLAGDLLVVDDATSSRLAIGTQGRRVGLVEVSSDGQAARALDSDFDPSRPINLRGGLVAVIRTFHDFDPES